MILEAQAVADLLAFFPDAMDARTADEGRSYFSKPGGGNRIGEKLFAESVTLRTDPFDARLPGAPWASERLPAQATTWIEKGVVQGAVGRPLLGARRPGSAPRAGGGYLIMEGGKGSVDELIAGTERGLLVTRFWYIRSVNPQTIQLTGLTRDGVWLVEKGKIVAPVNNFRFNESPANLLKNRRGDERGGLHRQRGGPAGPGARLPFLLAQRRGLNRTCGVPPRSCTNRY